MKLSILIVNWNTKDLVIRAVNAILKNSPEFDFEIVLVDNASTDGSQEALVSEFSKESRVNVVNSKKNLGFAGGNNLAFEQSSGEYLILLNPDTEVESGALDLLVKYLDEKSDVGIVGPKLLNPDGSIQKSVRRFPSLWSSILVFSGLHRLIKPNKYLMNDFDYDQMSEVDQVMGSALMTRRSIVEKLGLLDEKFYLWYEEVDFCKRVKQDGHKVMYYPEARIMHRNAQSFSQLRVWERKKTAAKSLLYYFKKHGNFFEVVFLFLAMIPVLIFAFVLNLFGTKTRMHV